MKNQVALFWFRRDLRLEDNAGLRQALQSGFPVLPVFIFDETLLTRLASKKDRRVDYIHQALTSINTTLKKHHSSLVTRYGQPLEIFKTLSDDFDIRAVFCNRDYEPQAIRRDTELDYFFKEKNIPFKTYKDQVIFDRSDILKNDGTPYTVYTPYAKKWKEVLSSEDYACYTADLLHFFRRDPSELLSPKDIGFEKTDIEFKAPELHPEIIDEYHKYRDYPAMQRTTRLGIALRFGTISIRKCVKFALAHNPVWLSELIWREFFMQILYHFPRVVGQSFKPEYDFIEWRNDEAEFRKWCEGKTGYPIVDAGMRQLNATGYMHNRVRMIVASFLCKHLLIDWRWGEAYFAEKLDDYDLAANNGNWQWAAGSGCDAAPYFRVFNPAAQAEKFDPALEYIRQWIPEWGTADYPPPMVEHSFARERALQVYRQRIVYSSR